MGTVPTPYTMGANAVVDSTAFNIGIRDALSFLLRPPGCIVRLTTAQSIPNGANTLITWDTEEFDSDAMFSASSSTITIKTAGVYSLLTTGSIGGATGVRYLNILLNGAVVAGSSTPAATPCRMSAGMSRVCSPGDTLQAQVFQNNGTAVNFEGPSDFPARMAINWIGNI